VLFGFWLMGRLNMLKAIHVPRAGAMKKCREFQLTVSVIAVSRVVSFARSAAIDRRMPASACGPFDPLIDRSDRPRVAYSILRWHYHGVRGKFAKAQLPAQNVIVFAGADAAEHHAA
jgi:hypothetical protein